MAKGKRKRKEDKPAECRPVICEDPKTGRITIRFGKCNPNERKRLLKKIERDGIDVLPPELDE